jgi:hypothetical protein
MTPPYRILGVYPPKSIIIRRVYPPNYIIFCRLSKPPNPPPKYVNHEGHELFACQEGNKEGDRPVNEIVTKARITREKGKRVRLIIKDKTNSNTMNKSFTHLHAPSPVSFID